MPEFSSIKIIEHRFHVENEKGESGIGYYTNIGRELMVQLGMEADFKRQVLQWYGTTVHMKEPSGMMGKSDLSKRKMREVVMQTAETDFTREATCRLVKILNSNYAKEDLKHLADNATQLNSEEITQLLIPLKDFEDLFDGNLGDWDTDTVNMDLKPGSKPFNSKYYKVPIIKKETFFKELKQLVEVGVLTLVQHSQYGTPIFTIPNKEGTLRFIKYYRRLNQQ